MIVGLANLEPFVGASPYVVAAAIGVPVAGKIVITALALRGTDPKDRPGIIKAVAELFRWRR
ncbi:hypothetical protein [Micromonospora sp. NPDC007220]|uniref:hypothetical protein n=1 Tax=Micromonospora sp. NPDC007220 TaxID=3154318 RepID=UPI0033EFAB0E